MNKVFKQFFAALAARVFDGTGASSFEFFEKFLVATLSDLLSFIIEAVAYRCARILAFKRHRTDEVVIGEGVVQSEVDHLALRIWTVAVGLVFIES